MDLKYNFLSEFEPTKKQLDELMHDVLVSVKERAKNADMQLQESIVAEIKKVRSLYREGN